MAGVVAMASVIEEFDTPPCKKTCKDGGSPVVKTITNYFSPVSKPAEKPFSPPRSNNIMDYFNRKGPSPKNRVLSPEQSKENCQSGKDSAPPPVSKPSATKRNRKVSKTARRLVETTEDTSCVIVEDIAATENGTASGVLGSDTAVLLEQICAESSVCEASSNLKSDKHKKSLIAKSSQHLKSIELSPILPPKEKSKKGKTPAPSKKKKRQKDELPEPELKETDKSLGDISMEVNLGDASQLNNSTVTISFEDFVRSQETTENELCKEFESVSDNEIPILSNKDNQESCLQTSPRMVTIQAEVHASLPKVKRKDTKKVSSIFNKDKSHSPQQAASPHLEPDLHVQPIVSKWKSNVVLEENDVELCVLESSSDLKCSQAERKQFMAAFKQPSGDGVNNKQIKGQGKPKQTRDKAANVCEEEAEIQCDAVQEIKSPDVQIKAAKKRQKKEIVKKNTSLTPTACPEEELDIAIKTDCKKEAQSNSSLAQAARRSRREAVTRQTSISNVVESSSKQTRKQVSTEDDSVSKQEDLVDLCTPKKRKGKHGVFKAEMTCPPDEMESPIRIRFSRVNRNKDNASSTPLIPKRAKESKKAKQAKKLLEKAKATKQSKILNEEKTVRRSSRSVASVKRSYCEDENSIICLEGPVTESQSVPEKTKSKTKSRLRSLNDVLGKAGSNKEAKTAPGSKVQEKVQDKAPRKSVSIFDESSQEGSENSQDDEQFRARREFLKSGLPESFKKQIIKTAAAKEAYVTACVSFQPVMHIYQRPNECPFWSLPWPQSVFLNQLKDNGWQFSNHPIEKNLLINWKTQPIHRTSSNVVSSWRHEISAGAREVLMKEISNCNSAFPVQKFMSLFLKKQSDLCTSSEPASVFKPIPTEASSGKRKRSEEEETVKAAKKQRSTCQKGTTADKREGRTRRGAKAVTEDSAQTPVQSEDTAVIVLDDSPLVPQTVEQDVFTEDALWTDKYQPQHSSEVIGNTSGVRQLHSWLKEWKLRADKEDRKKQKEQKLEDSSVDSDWECGEEDSRDVDDLLCNTLLITGPCGIGKTAAVYACAQELGFKIFEVNASSQRSGRLILSQLKEATQSHQVDTQGLNAHKPTYFNSYSASSSALRPGSSPRKVGSPRRAVSSPRKLPQSPRTGKRGGLAPTALANFFKMSKPGNKELPKSEEKKGVAKKKSIDMNKMSSLKSLPDVLSKDGTDLVKKTATSLILFEEVDVIFEEDTGFLSAIKTFMTTTKRPVILTTSDPAFGAMFDGSFEEIVFKPPSELNVASYLQLLCLAENVRTELKDISALLSLNHCDIRRTLLQLQFWTRSGGLQTTTPPSGKNEEQQQKPEEVVTNTSASKLRDPEPLPVCETGCTESMLGLLNISPQHNIWELLKTSDAALSSLVAMGRLQGVGLLHANMETLLPLPTTTASTSSRRKQQPHCPPSPDHLSVNPSQPHRPTLHARLRANEDDFSDDASPVKVSNRMKKNRKKHCPPEQGGLQSDSDSESEFLSLMRQSAVVEKYGASRVPQKVVRKPPSHEEQILSVPVSQSLRSVADFLDDMSFMDFLSNEDSRANETWCAAVLKDGLTDEQRMESVPMAGCGPEIYAQVESLSFNKCSASLCDAWNKVQQLEEALREEAATQLTLPVAPHNERCTFTQRGSCPPHVVLERREVMDDLCLKGVFGSVVSRSAAAQDYLPALRAICKTEQLKEQGKVKRRFLHYLDAIHMGLQKSTLEHLAEDFP
ncbi:unnamed protein product [Knipowitschia caucasica]